MCIRDRIYADLVRRGHAHGIKVAIDSSGAPFTAAIPASPDLIKPNHEELEELVGRRLHSPAEVGAAARTRGALVAQAGSKSLR